MRKEPNKTVPAWAVGLLVGVLLIGMAIICYLGLWYTAEHRHTTFALFELNWPKIKHTKLCLIVTSLVMTLTVIWFTSWYGQTQRRKKVFWAVIGVAGLTLVATIFSCKLYTNELAYQGIGTMQTALDTEYHQEEMKLMGNLGVYGGQITLDGETQTYICRQMDTFGPFTDQLLEDTEDQPFSVGYEAYSRFEQDGLVQLHSVSVCHYDDGYWLIVKRFVDVRDLYIESGPLNDLQKYIVQMQYNRHTGSEKDMARGFEETAGDAVSRTR